MSNKIHIDPWGDFINSALESCPQLVQEYIKYLEDKNKLCTYPSQKDIHQNAIKHGFWEAPINIPEKLCLIHEEVSECLTGIRKNIPKYEKGGIAEELADVVIRCMDMAEHLGIDLMEQIRKKHEINVKRPYKHGKKF